MQSEFCWRDRAPIRESPIVKRKRTLLSDHVKHGVKAVIFRLLPEATILASIPPQFDHSRQKKESQFDLSLGANSLRREALSVLNSKRPPWLLHSIDSTRRPSTMRRRKRLTSRVGGVATS